MILLWSNEDSSFSCRSLVFRALMNGDLALIMKHERNSFDLFRVVGALCSCAIYLRSIVLLQPRLIGNWKGIQTSAAIEGWKQNTWCVRLLIQEHQRGRYRSSEKVPKHKDLVVLQKPVSCLKLKIQHLGYVVLLIIISCPQFVQQRCCCCIVSR